MEFIKRIKDNWPFVTKTRFNRLKKDRDALLKEHRNMSDYVLQLNSQVSEASLIMTRAVNTLKGINFF